jgi:hypothetical protein
MCQRDATYDFSDLKTRMNRITTTARITESGGGDTATFFYTDARKNTNGSWITESVSTDVFNVMSSESTCDMACKTRKQTEDTEAGLTGNTTQYRTSATSYTFYYRLCTNGTCPLQVGEEVVKRCQCINEFAEATTILMSPQRGEQGYNMQYRRKTMNRLMLILSLVFVIAVPTYSWGAVVCTKDLDGNGVIDQQPKSGPATRACRCPLSPRRCRVRKSPL